MLCVIPFFAGDRHLALQLAQHIERIGGVKHHTCLLVVDKGTMKDGVVEPLQKAFASVEVIFAEPAGAQGTWGNGTTDATAANEMFLTAAIYVQERLKVPFFWMEPDATPTRSTWLDEIEAEYKNGRKAFMGAYVNIPPHEPHMSGVAVYPAIVAEHSMDMMRVDKYAWDYTGRHDTVGKGKAHFTNLIQHEYRVHGESPTFPTQESLKVIRPETAVFHRCKDDSLVKRLLEKKGGDASCAINQHQDAPAEGQPETTTVQGMAANSIASNAAPTFHPEVAALTKRVEALEAVVARLNVVNRFQNSGIDSSAPRKQGVPMKRSRGSVRTPEQVASDKARMAKARAGRKAKA